MKIYCPAKINVFLDITKKYKNEYHKIESVFLETNLCDELNYKIISSEKCIIKNLPSDIDPENNLINKAYETFFKYSNSHKIGIEIDIIKNIPLGGGLGGGSSDAAGILKILNRLCNTKFSSAKLKEIGKKIGSDVPYFIDCGTQKVTGTGEITNNIKSS